MDGNSWNSKIRSDPQVHGGIGGTVRDDILALLCFGEVDLVCFLVDCGAFFSCICLLQGRCCGLHYKFVVLL
jgi:hypothetical protein